ncbi:HIT family protein [Nonomuraea sp. CA-218870]|uniref:HIT family protein n=1 Tax=Nonomuraea sp. CA-218870 TaxID=3239998 RepID=UPI003D9165D0
MTDLTSCVFCDILAGEAPATIVRSWSTAIAIKPLNPVTEGHTLVIPATHVRDVTEDPEVSAMTMEVAAEYAAGVGPCNVITSVGREATQTVFHLHIHVVPRRAEDGLALPWSPSVPSGMLPVPRWAVKILTGPATIQEKCLAQDALRDALNAQEAGRG